MRALLRLLGRGLGALYVRLRYGRLLEPPDELYEWLDLRCDRCARLIRAEGYHRADSNETLCPFCVRLPYFAPVGAEPARAVKLQRPEGRN